MTSEQPAYSGLSFRKLLQLEVELCTPLKRAEWVKQVGVEPIRVCVAMLNEVLELWTQGLNKNDLASALESLFPGGTNLKEKTYAILDVNRVNKVKDHRSSWRCSQKLLRAMLLGLRERGFDEKCQKVANRIVKFFFPEDLTVRTKLEDLPPPFFREERTDSDYIACPHDEREANFYAVSLAQKHYRSGARVRWFMASGGDFLQSLSGSEFDQWAEWLSGALCFDLDFTFLIPETGHLPIEDFIRKFEQYSAKQLDLEIFRNRYPDLQELISQDWMKRQFQAHFKVRPVSITSELKDVDLDRARNEFPLKNFATIFENQTKSKVCAPTFLNPWLRFHWVDIVCRTSKPICEPQFAAIAYNDVSRNNHLIFVQPDAMSEYLKWLSVFAQDKEQSTVPSSDPIPKGFQPRPNARAARSSR